LTCKAHCPAIIGDIKRLDPVGVTREEQAPSVSIPNCDGKHAAEAAHHVFTLKRIEVQDRLGVRRCAKLTAFGFKIAA
jgi:hypothetical protein